MRTWQWGRSIMAEAYRAFTNLPMQRFIELKQRLMDSPGLRVDFGERKLAQIERSIVFLASRPILSVETPARWACAHLPQAHRCAAQARYPAQCHAGQPAIRSGGGALRGRPARGQHRGGQRPVWLHAEPGHPHAAAHPQAAKASEDSRAPLDGPDRGGGHHLGPFTVHASPLGMRLFRTLLRISTSADAISA